MGKKRIVLDTNILISAFGWHGKPKEIFSKVLNKEFELIISQKQIEEIKRVLNYKKFNFTSEQKIKFLEILFLEAKVVEIKNRLDVIKEDPSDNMILETAIENDVEFFTEGKDTMFLFETSYNIFRNSEALTIFTFSYCFNFTSEQKIKFLEILFLEAKVVEIKNRLDVIKEDPSDNMILETAIENDVEFIISGDDHLLKLKQYENVKIVSASEFLKML